MFARKLSHLAGLVFVLVAVTGGAGAFVTGAEYGTGGTTIVADDTGVTSDPTSPPPAEISPEPVEISPLELDWT